MPISVIIPTRNAARILGRQLEALAAQAGAALGEVLVADNGSQDDLAGTIREWESRLPGLRVIDASTTAGAAHARNVGARAARFDAIAFCDADDVVGPQWVLAMEESLAANDLVTGPMDLVSLNPEWLARSRLDGGTDPMKEPWTAGWLPFGFGANIGVTRRAFQAVGGFDETMRASEDMDFCWRVQLAGFPLRFEPRAVVAYLLTAKLWRIFRKQIAYSRSYVFLCRKFIPLGYPVQAKFSPRRLARRWYRTLIRDRRRLKTRAGRAATVFEIGDHLGLMLGAVLYRVAPF